jgi:hypothetical protein
MPQRRDEPSERRPLALVLIAAPCAARDERRDGGVHIGEVTTGIVRPRHKRAKDRAPERDPVRAIPCGG